MSEDEALRAIHLAESEDERDRARERLAFDEAVGSAVGAGGAPARRAERDGPARAAEDDGLAAAPAGAVAVRADRRARATCSTCCPPNSPDTRRCTGCCRARSARARRSSRCWRCCRWSTPGTSARCSRRRKCLPPNMPARSATCSARWPWRVSSAVPTSATRVALLTGSMSAQQKRQVRDEVASGAGRASSSARTRCCRTPSTSTNSAWSWSTSSTGSVSSSEIDCAPRRPTASRRTCW